VPEFFGEVAGGCGRQSQKSNYHYNSYNGNHEYDCKSDEEYEQHIVRSGVYSSQSCEFFVEGKSKKLLIEEDSNSYHKNIQQNYEDQFLSAYKKDVAEKITHRINVAWCFCNKKEAYCHPDSPDSTYNGIAPLGGPAGNKTDYPGRQEGGDNSTM